MNTILQDFTKQASAVRARKSDGEGSSRINAASTSSPKLMQKSVQTNSNSMCTSKLRWSDYTQEIAEEETKIEIQPNNDRHNSVYQSCVTNNSDNEINLRMQNSPVDTGCINKIETLNQQNADQKLKLEHQQQQLNEQKLQLDAQKKQLDHQKEELDELKRLLDSA